MNTQPLSIQATPAPFPSIYREVKIGRTVYCVTSIFTGEKELGPALEKLAARRVLDELDSVTKEVLRNGQDTKY